MLHINPKPIVFHLINSVDVAEVGVLAAEGVGPRTDLSRNYKYITCFATLEDGTVVHGSKGDSKEVLCRSFHGSFSIPLESQLACGLQTTNSILQTHNLSKLM